MSETYVAAAIGSVADQRPKAQIVVRVDHWLQLTDWLLAGELDFYVADMNRAQIDGRFDYTSLPAQPLVWFCRSGHPLAKRKMKTVKRTDLLRFPIAAPNLPAWALEWFAAALSDEGVAGLPRPFPALMCESYSMLKQFILSSDCISAALRQTLTGELQDRSITILPVDAPELTTQAGIVRLADRTLSPLAADVVTAIEHRAHATQ
jgi:DNA-binding transcriptional LysR family regulator